jgi:hypothetical protein
MVGQIFDGLASVRKCLFHNSDCRILSVPRHPQKLMARTCKTMAGVLPNEYCTLHCLLEYISNDVGQALQLVRDQPDFIDK